MFTIAVAATKGGVGKTTLAAHLAGVLRGLGQRVLLIDADVQPSLTKFFTVSHVAPAGLTDLITRGILTDDCISSVELPLSGHPGITAAADAETRGCLHLVMSDTSDGKLQDWMFQRPAYMVRLKTALRNSRLAGDYDYIIIDTQGAIGHLQDAAVIAADVVVVPASPDIISAREFISGTQRMLERANSVRELGLDVPPMYAVINRTENTNDSRLITDLIREQFAGADTGIRLLQTTIRNAVAFRKAATSRVPVHWLDSERCGELMHQLLWEIVPELHGQYASSYRPNTTPTSTSDKD